MKEEIHQLSKDSNEGPTPSNQSQLTPPTSENAPSGDVMLTNPDGPNDAQVEFGQDVAGNLMDNGGSLPNEMYPEFTLSDFSNEISGDGNFNLETFLNTDGNDVTTSFDSYWRDSVEATE